MYQKFTASKIMRAARQKSIASSSTRSASLGEFWTQVDSSLAAVDALKTLGAPARGLPWTCRFVVISTFYFAYEIARYALSKRELRSRVNAHAPATTLRYRPKNSFITGISGWRRLPFRLPLHSHPAARLAAALDGFFLYYRSRMQC